MTNRLRCNGEWVEITDVSPTLTVLEWLRQTGRTGTKEGCAEGDCGACTIAVLESNTEGQGEWRSSCACIMLLPQVFGKTIVTVEGLAEKDMLHPAQSAMVDHLGSQCGYCTPGFVMSLFEATYREDLKSPWQFDDQICGNLCRCTGYRPIRDALHEVAGTRPDDQFKQVSQTYVDDNPEITYSNDGQTYHRPTTWDALWAALKTPDARIVSGSTDLGLHVTQKHIHYPHLVDLGGLAPLKRLVETDEMFSIGAGVSLSDLETWSHSRLPALSKMLRYFASRQIKNRATIGGNLCNASPIGDLPPVLIAMDAVAVIQSASGVRRVPFAGHDEVTPGFWLDYRQTVLAPGEILSAIEIPRPDKDVYCSSYKVSKRRELDISAVSACFAIRIDESGRVEQIRAAYGGMAATPARAYAVENELLGHPLTDERVNAGTRTLATTFTPMDDHRGSAWYRRTVAENLLRGFVSEFVNQVPVQLSDRPSGTVMSGGAK